MLKVELDTEGRRVISLSDGGLLRAEKYSVMIYETPMFGRALLSLFHPKNNKGEVISPSDDELVEIAEKWGGAEFASLMYERVFAWFSEKARIFTLNSFIDLGRGRIHSPVEGWYLAFDPKRSRIVCRSRYDMGDLLSFEISFRTAKECSDYLEEIQSYGVESACEILAYKLTEKLRAGEHWVKS